MVLLGENCQLKNIKLPIPNGYPLTSLVIGKDIHPHDKNFLTNFELTKEQAVLVRPDGHIAWISG